MMMLKTDAIIDTHTLKVTIVADFFRQYWEAIRYVGQLINRQVYASYHHLCLYSHAPKVESVRIFYIVQLHLPTDDSWSAYISLSNGVSFFCIQLFLFPTIHFLLLLFAWLMYNLLIRTMMGQMPLDNLTFCGLWYKFGHRVAHGNTWVDHYCTIVQWTKLYCKTTIRAVELNWGRFQDFLQIFQQLLALTCLFCSAVTGMSQLSRIKFCDCLFCTYSSTSWVFPYSQTARSTTSMRRSLIRHAARAWESRQVHYCVPQCNVSKLKYNQTV